MAGGSVLDTLPQASPGNAEAERAVPVIEAAGVSKTYRMGRTEVHALRDANLVVHRGEMIAIMGASGSGKSTLMNILGCLDVPTSGTYTLEGVRVDGMSRNDLADIRNTKVGFVFQGFNLLARTSALDNVELPLLYDRTGKHRDPRALAAEALRRVDLGDRLDHDPSELSGGEQQRVALARAIVTNPTLLLADEPTGNLDSRTSVEVMTLLQQLNDEGTTILLVTHESNIAAYAKRIVLMKDGRLIRDEPIPHRRNAAGDLRALPPEPEDA